MKHGEFIKLTAELSDNEEIVVRNIFDEELSIGKVLESVEVINLNGKFAKWKESIFSWDDLHEYFFLL